MWSLVYAIISNIISSLKATHTVTASANGCHQDLSYQAEASVTILTREILLQFICHTDAWL